jgi:hypothetical protein
MSNIRRLVQLELEGLSYIIKKLPTFSCLAGSHCQDFPRNSVFASGGQFSVSRLSFSNRPRFFGDRIVISREITTLSPYERRIDQPMDNHLAIVTFECESKLIRIWDRTFFCWKSLASFYIPRNVQYLGPKCLAGCHCLGVVTFESGSRLTHIP